jgi:NADH-quinone oxidoreductase subunit N
VAVAAGLGFKVAAFPFHLWAPDAYEGAPAPAAAFIASVSKVASFALLITITAAILPSRWSLLLVILAAASMFAGNLAALAQVSVRRLLAYSAIAHAGYMLLGLAYFSDRSRDALLYYIVTYALTTIGAFGVVGVVERATGTDRFDGFLGLNKRNPLLAAVLLVLFLSLAGIPPLVGFWAKFNLFAAVLTTHASGLSFALVALAVGFSAVSLYYYLQVLKRAFVMAPTDENRITVDPVVMLVLLLIAAAVVVLGCFPALLQNWIGIASKAF